MVEGKSLTRAQLSAIAMKMMARDPSTAIKFVKVRFEENSGRNCFPN